MEGEERINEGFMRNKLREMNEGYFAKKNREPQFSELENEIFFIICIRNV